MSAQQRSEAEWKFGMDAPPQNAFVSGWPKKVLQRHSSFSEQVGTGGWSPRSRTTSKKWSPSLPHKGAQKADSDKQGGTTGVASRRVKNLAPPTLVPSMSLRKGRGIVLRTVANSSSFPIHCPSLLQAEQFEGALQQWRPITKHMQPRPQLSLIAHSR